METTFHFSLMWGIVISLILAAVLLTPFLIRESKMETSVDLPDFHWLIRSVTAPGFTYPCHSQRRSGFARCLACRRSKPNW